MDINRLNRGEKIAGAAAVLLFIDTFLSWYSLNVSSRVADQAAGFGINLDTSFSAWQIFSMTDLLMLLTILVVLAMVGMKASGRSVDLPVSLPLVAAALSAFTTLIVLYRIVNQPHDNRILNVEYGAYLGLLILIAMTYGAIQAGGGVDELRAEAGTVSDRVTTSPGSEAGTPAATAAPSVAETVTPAPVPAPAVATDPAPPPPPPTPSPPPPAPDPAPPAPAPDPEPTPAPEPAPPVPEPAPPAPGSEPAGPTIVHDEDEPLPPSPSVA